MAQLYSISFVLFVAFGVDARSFKPTPVPKWPATFKVTGTLSLPYAELEEPFTAYFDSKNNRSRIDYYGDAVLTYQFSPNGSAGDYGKTWKVAYMSNLTVFNTRTCFLTNGTNTSSVALQSVLPNLTDFTLSEGMQLFNGINVSVWMKVEMKGQKKNTYKMMVSADKQIPVRYEMYGYDTLLGSHYDKYYLDYTSYTTENITDKDFMYKDNATCGGFPGPGDSEQHILSNPMREYINNEDSHHQELFKNFRRTHSKSYEDETETAKRESLFRQNVRFIHSKNRASLGYTLAVNHMADMSKDELRLFNGRLHSKGYNGGLPFDKTKYKNVGLPDQINWRLLGAVTPVKDQAVCGSCWSFGTTGTIEGAYFLATGKLVRLSQQQLMDCSWGQGNNACDGGEDFRAYNYTKLAGGLSSEEQYGPYKGQDMKCNKDVKRTVQLESYVNITENDQEALQLALVFHGPISVSIDASHLTLSFYANGVYYEEACKNGPDDLDHSVLAVGYGVLHGQGYWLIKNSWSTYWGNDGYVLMSMKNNNCGVATAATFVNIKKNTL